MPASTKAVMRVNSPRTIRIPPAISRMPPIPKIEAIGIPEVFHNALEKKASYLRLKLLKNHNF